MLTAALALISSFNSRADYENRIRFLFDNRDALESRIDMIRGAQANLDISYFLIGDTNDKVSVAGLALLQKAAERGVLIRLLVDGRFNKIPQPSMALLKQSGVQIREYRAAGRRCLFNLKWRNRRLHDKLVLTDKQYLLLGGRNIEDAYFGESVWATGDEAAKLKAAGKRVKRNYLDRDVFMVGPEVQKAQIHFDRIWDGTLVSDADLGDFELLFSEDDCGKKKREAKRLACFAKLEELQAQTGEIQEAFDDRLEKVRTGYAIDPTKSPARWIQESTPVHSVEFLSDPEGKKNREGGIADRLVQLVESLPDNENIYVENSYFALTKRARKLFKRAFSRGMSITVLTNSLQSFENTMTLAAYHWQLPRNLKLGIQVYELHGDHTEMIHSKVAVFENSCQSFIGSFNLDPRSANFNTEVGIVISDCRVSAFIKNEIVERIESKSLRIDPETALAEGYTDACEGIPKKQCRNFKLLKMLMPIFFPLT